MKTTLGLLAFGLLATPMTHAHGTHIPLSQQAQPVTITTTDLGDGLYMLQGRGGNIGVLVGGRRGLCH